MSSSSLIRDRNTARQLLQELDACLSCPVCERLITAPISLPCRHSYCRTCVQNLLEAGNASCVECKNPFWPDDVRINQSRTSQIELATKLARAVKHMYALDDSQDQSSSSSLSDDDDQADRNQRCRIERTHTDSKAETTREVIQLLDLKDEDAMRDSEHAESQDSIRNHVDDDGIEKISDTLENNCIEICEDLRDGRRIVKLQPEIESRATLLEDERMQSSEDAADHFNDSGAVLTSATKPISDVYINPSVGMNDLFGSPTQMDPPLQRVPPVTVNEPNRLGQDEFFVDPDDVEEFDLFGSNSMSSIKDDRVTDVASSLSDPPVDTQVMHELISRFPASPPFQKSSWIPSQVSVLSIDAPAIDTQALNDMEVAQLNDSIDRTFVEAAEYVASCAHQILLDENLHGHDIDAREEVVEEVRRNSIGYEMLHDASNGADTEIVVHASPKLNISKISGSVRFHPSRNRVIMTSLIAARDIKTLKSFINSCRTATASILSSYDPCVTHLIIRCTKPSMCSRTIKYLQAVLSGCWIVSSDWIEACSISGRWVDEADFEVKCDQSLDAIEGVPKRARLQFEAAREQCRQPFQLFCNLCVVFKDPWADIYPPRQQLEQLVKIGGVRMFHSVGDTVLY